MSKDISQALADCLSMLDEQGAQTMSLEECLAQYPEHASELRGLLETAIVLRQANGAVPSPEFRSRARTRLLRKLPPRPGRVATPTPTPNPAPTTAPSPWQRLAGAIFGRRTAVALAFALLLILFFGIALPTASNALPGQFLYPLKNGTERARLALAQGDAADADLHLRFAATRLDEIGRLIAQDTPGRVPVAVRGYLAHLHAAQAIAQTATAAGTRADVATTLRNRLAQDELTLAAMMPDISPDVDYALGTALMTVDQSRASAERVLVTVAPTSLDKMALYLQFATDRLTAANALSALGQETLLAQALSSYEDQISEAMTLAVNEPEDETREQMALLLEDALADHQVTLAALQETAPPAAQPALTAAQTATDGNQETVNALLAPAEDVTDDPDAEPVTADEEPDGEPELEGQPDLMAEPTITPTPTLLPTENGDGDDVPAPTVTPTLPPPAGDDTGDDNDDGDDDAPPSTPPGSSGDAPGQNEDNPPPGQGGTPPGQIDNDGPADDPPPGQGDTPPGQGDTPPGQGDTPPGQGNGNDNNNGGGKP